ncbi:NAD-dependent epimerase/dehydratase family protein [Streptomyces uncialis]|uniref:NAD-dependent epimerase/dehydratase family protein n=1 Tax=Streptomyces uncialis TaxID=1048205 RepID=UPI0038688020|nr:NAD-dependent epimerase/dehydratase family protein [Streptomyces uncialis]
MRILVLGGTWFLGRAVAVAAVDRGWDVSVFNRGRSGSTPDGTRALQGDRTNVHDLAKLARGVSWDAVIDTSASELAPRDVLAGARALQPVAGRYVYVSTVSAYQGWPAEALTESSVLLDAPADADADFGRLPDGWKGPDLHYGRQKAGAERASVAAFGPDRVSILRPGVILGPGEYVGRLPWWLRRAERGGAILAPGEPGRTIQPVDVRDVAAFALDQAAATTGGAYNVTAPIGRETMGGFLGACLEVTAGDGHLVWTPDDVLKAARVRQWTELPLWRTQSGVWNIESTRAREAGFACRPLSETVRDTWRWLSEGGTPVAHPRWARHGIDPVKEAEILARS